MNFKPQDRDAVRGQQDQDGPCLNAGRCRASLPLAEAAKAHELLESGRTAVKIALTV